MTEACAVVPEGRISPSDAGMWNDAQVEVCATQSRCPARCLHTLTAPGRRVFGS